MKLEKSKKKLRYSKCFFSISLLIITNQKYLILPTWFKLIIEPFSSKLCKENEKHNSFKYSTKKIEEKWTHQRPYHYGKKFITLTYKKKQFELINLRNFTNQNYLELFSSLLEVVYLFPNFDLQF